MIVNKDQIKGRFKEAEGNAKEIAGKMAGDEPPTRPGSPEEIRIR
jgi:uncharacterized protein YjbJ (UPF0337 family)